MDGWEKEVSYRWKTEKVSEGLVGGKEKIANYWKAMYELPARDGQKGLVGERASASSGRKGFIGKNESREREFTRINKAYQFRRQGVYRNTASRSVRKKGRKMLGTERPAR